MPALDKLLENSIDALNKLTVRLEEKERKMVAVEEAAKKVGEEIERQKVEPHLWG